MDIELGTAYNSLNDLQYHSTSSEVTLTSSYVQRIISARGSRGRIGAAVATGNCAYIA